MIPCELWIYCHTHGPPRVFTDPRRANTRIPAPSVTLKCLERDLTADAERPIMASHDEPKQDQEGRLVDSPSRDILVPAESSEETVTHGD